MSEAAWRSPSALGTGAALAIHVALFFACLLVHITVRPMAAPPIEVELMAGDVSSRPEVSTRGAPPMAPATVGERRGEVMPLPSRTMDEPVLPELPRMPASDRSPMPSLSSPPGALTRGPSPGAHLAPVALETDTLTPAAGVRVRVEGTLSSRRLVHLVNPAFPADAPSGGVVKVRLAVNADGTIRLATLVLKAQPALDEASLEALRQWRFAPADTPEAVGVVTVEFVLR